jgi:hypothetical protein
LATEYVYDSACIVSYDVGAPIMVRVSIWCRKRLIIVATDGTIQGMSSPQNVDNALELSGVMVWMLACFLSGSDMELVTRAYPRRVMWMPVCI